MEQWQESKCGCSSSGCWPGGGEDGGDMVVEDYGDKNGLMWVET